MSRSRKRAPSDIEVTNGKKFKPESGEEKEVKPYICPIYRRDIASFLPRWTIEKLRLTSRLSNGSIIEFPASLPRFVHPGLTVVVASAGRCVLLRSGFLGHRGMDGHAFHRIYKFRLCCSDVKAKASELVGQRVFPQMPADEGVALMLSPRNGKTPVTTCRLPNELTKKTAPVLLHFLHHLKPLAFESVDIDMERATITDPEQCTFNPAILQALRPATAVKGSKKADVLLRAVKFGRSRGGRGQLGPATVRLAEEMRVRYGSLQCAFDGERPELQQLLDFIATGRDSVGKDKRLDVVLQIPYNNLIVDIPIQYFHESVQQLGGAIRDVRFTSSAPIPIHGEPTTCTRNNRVGFVSKMRDGVEESEHDYSFVNANSGERFYVVLVTRLDNAGKEVIHAMQLLLGARSDD